jgi:hypothetical protein
MRYNTNSSYILTHMSEERDGGESDCFLAATLSTNANEGTSSFPDQCTSHPKLSCCIHESPHLGWGRTIATRQTKKKSIILRHLVRRHDGIVRLWRRIHLFQDFFREGLRNLKDVNFGASFTNPLGNGFAQGRDVAVERVLDDCNLGHDGLVFCVFLAGKKKL